MLRLTRYLKPYIYLVLISVVLLFVQANADLALPDYMSKIVNIGIQQGGVENAVPVAIRQSEMNKLVIFMSADEKAMALGDYTLVDKTSPDYETYLQEYPVLASEPVYVLNAVDSAEIEKLNPVMGRAFLVVAGIEQVMADPEKASQMAAGKGFDLPQLPPGVDIFTVLSQLPPESLSQISGAFDEQFASLGDSMIIQAAAAPIKAEYAALGMDAGKMQNDYILRIGFWMLLLTLLSGTCTITVGFLSARTAAGLARDLRRNVFQRVESFSSAEFDKFSTASLITRSTNDITQIQMVVLMIMRMVIYAPIIGIGGIIRALSKTTSMWWIIALAVVVLLGLILTVFSIALPRFKSIQKLIDRLNLVTRENLSGMMVIRAFNMQKFEEGRFDKANQDLTGTLLFINRVMVVMMPVMMMIMNGLMLLIIWVGSHEVAQSQMQVGDMMAFMQYAMQIVFAFLMLAMMFIMLPRAAVSGERIADVLETRPAINDPERPAQFPAPFQGTIEFRDVSFRYPGAEEDVLHHITFTARAGQTTAFIGTTGSGKSTIVSLIPRFYEVSSGAILVDGMDIRDVTQHDLREKIGYIPQKSNLFSGTIESNLRYADENASEEELKLAAGVSQAAEFISASPEGMQAEISQGGANVSGGQKQRLSIARALVKKAPIYIFDDSFSALDFKTDAALRKSLKENTASSTILIVTQRVPTIKNADLIIVLDEGRIACMGAHADLMKECDVYREIALSQLSKEELA
ncbi:MAG: ABC-type multidrug transport system ATPase and permease component [Anaerolineaceae bacterium]|nr:MAG: ABC-type multidrug transport system ATPase and permease component [Anaerolineaceae bacterium]